MILLWLCWGNLDQKFDGAPFLDRIVIEPIIVHLVDVRNNFDYKRERIDHWSVDR